ncbi:protein serine/threonine phosphatase [Solidesulfovibrio fructosivorans JJ]]|uniref:Protein serine/threonine phosphatase n=1 Tax=Solidesulfovibrio fructosivorans JJ] TaxID=596151 RepID=E1JWV9_SOLFR|nr:SpoIIE family protein phosphatase [Solidesulfovibrio fructosivorans]EFL51163.1 protein serine/threonine phosphatase [Solidesulfovibrio fructosivorans JJ]]
MRIRTKLLIFLLALVLPPLIVVSTYAVWESQNLGQKLADGAEENLVRTAQQHLQLSLAVMRSDMRSRQHKLERSLNLVVKEAEALLIGPPRHAKPAIFDTESERQAVLPSSLVREGEEAAPLVFHAPPDMDHSVYLEDAGRLLGLEPAFTVLFPREGGVRPQGWVRLASGLGCYVPEQKELPVPPPSLDTAWHDVSQGIVRGQIKRAIGQSDGQVTATLRKGIYFPDGRLAGVAGVESPICSAAPDKKWSSLFDIQMRFLLLEARSTPAGGSALHLVGNGELQGRNLVWETPHDGQQLHPGQSPNEALLIQDIQAGRSGVRDVRLAGVPVFLAYQPLLDGLTLAVAAPRDAILAHADRAEDAIMGQTWKILSLTAAVAVLAISAVVLLAVSGSRVVTRPVAALATAAKRLAEGDLATSVSVAGRDELSDLSRAFNAMVPQLAERLVLKQDMELAMEVQQTLLPREAPVLPGLDIAAASVFCDATGGDYYDFLTYAAADGPCCDIVIGDATGHGIAAALLMTTSRALLRGCATQQVLPGAQLAKANTLLCRDTDMTGRFVTLFYLRLEAGGIAPAGKLLWARAGHDPGMLFDPKTDTFRELQGKGIALGVSPDYLYETFSCGGLLPGQVLVLATDGAWEARNGQGEMFGKERFRDVVRRYAARTSKDLVEALQQAIREYQGGAPVEDDVTVVVIKA